MKIAALSLTVLILAACGPVEEDALSESGLTGRKPVQLLYAKGKTYWGAQGTAPAGHAIGYIKVDNLAYNKDVAVRYRIRYPQQQPDTWRDAAASYVDSIGDGYEAWYFETERVSFPARLGTDLFFAIRYRVNGEEHWDNNRGNNYQVGGGTRVVGPEMILGAAKVTLRDAEAWERQDGSLDFRARIVLRNIDYHKDVRMIHSVDDWATANETSATYMNGGTGGLAGEQPTETWQVQTTLPAGSTRLLFAIRYGVDGKVYWDNNMRRNYALDLPGKL